MLEKIESGKEYLNPNGSKVKTIYVGDTVILYIVNNQEATTSKGFTLKYWTEIPVQKKPTKFLAYVDADGGFFYSEERMSVHKSCKRIPSKDFDAIVED